MANPAAIIRSFEPQDEKLVRFMVGKANMELLASANNSVYRNPLFLAVWIALSSAFIQFAGWWPTNLVFWQYLKPLPGLASVAVPLLFVVDWYHRQEFEAHAQAAIRSPDVRELEKFYSKSPGSGLWILEYGDTFVGLIAIDCSKDGDTLPLTQKAYSRPKSAVNGQTVGAIRHFYVVELYRTANIQDDLLKHAVDHAFAKNPKLDRIQATGYGSLILYLEASLRRAGFKRGTLIKTMGLLRWEVSNYNISRTKS